LERNLLPLVRNAAASGAEKFQPDLQDHWLEAEAVAEQQVVKLKVLSI